MPVYITPDFPAVTNLNLILYNLLEILGMDEIVKFNEA